MFLTSAIRGNHYTPIGDHEFRYSSINIWALNMNNLNTILVVVMLRTIDDNDMNKPQHGWP